MLKGTDASVFCMKYRFVAKIFLMGPMVQVSGNAMSDFINPKNIDLSVLESVGSSESL